MPFKKLFHSSEKATDGLSQAAREAVVDALHYCMYADKHVAAREDEFIEAAARTLNWDSKISYEYYEGKSTAAARQAVSDDGAAEAFFETLRSRLSREAERDLVLRLAGDLVKSDGHTTERETTALARLRAAFARKSA